MYYYSKKSRNKIIHTSVCGCVGKRIESFGTLPTLQIAFSKGYRLCRRCNTLAKQYEKEQQKIQNYCSQNGMMTRYEKGYLRVKSNLDEWLLAVRGNGKIALFHRNAYDFNNNFKKPFSGCHWQKAEFASLIEYFQYIEHHDRYRQKNPLFSKSSKNRKKRNKGNEVMKNAKNRARKRSIRHTLTLIESMNHAYKVKDWV